MIVVMLILQLVAGMVLVNVSAAQRSERLSRAGEQVIVALRYARMLAMSSGQPVGVEFNTATSQMRVFYGASATTVSNNLMSGGTYVVNFAKQADVAGVTFSSAAITARSANPYQVVFGTFGGTQNSGTITLSYGGQRITVQIPAVGDAKVQ